MGSLLIARWLAGASAIDVRDDASIAVAREAARAAARQAGFDNTRVETLALVASELARNQLAHARHGRIAVRGSTRAGTPGVEIVAADEGPGIDPARAFREEPSARGGMGAGLGGVCRLADEVDFDVRLGEGSCVRARLFARPVTRRDVTILGRPCAGETLSGDDAAVVETDDTLFVAVADGLGHGELAREAAARAIDEVAANATRPLDEILARCGAALDGTRGAAVSLARIDPAGLSHAGVGNISLHVYAQLRAPTVRFIGQAGVVDGRRGPRRVHVEGAALPERHLIAIFTDGVSSHLDLAHDPRAFVDPPLVVAHRLLASHGANHDDALVVLAR